MYNGNFINGNQINLLLIPWLVFNFLMLIAPVHSDGQGFLTRQIIQSGLTIDAEYQPGDYLYDHDLNFFRSRAGISVPVKSKFTIKPDFKKFALTDLEVITDWKKKALPLLQKYFQPKMHQIIWNLNLNYAHFQDDAQIQHMTGLTTGLTGFHYLKKANFVFYSGNIGFNENPERFEDLDLQASALGGWATLYGMRSIFYAGGFIGYANNRVFPSPFVGFDTRVGKRLRLNVTLPVQIKLTYRKKKNRLSAFVALSGFVSGYEPIAITPPQHSTDYNIGHLNASYLKSGIDYSFKVGKRSRLGLTAGYLSWRQFRFTYPMWPETTALTKGTPYVGFRLNQKLGKSLFDASIGNMLN